MPQARVYKVWNIPPYGTRDANLLNLVSDVLAQGKSSRFYKRLVYQDQIATDAQAYVDLNEIGGQFTVVATARRVFTSLHGQHGGDEVLRRAASVLTLTGEDFLPAVVREVADMLDADVAFVGELTGTDRLRTVASWRNGAPGDSVEYSLAGSPLGA